MATTGSEVYPLAGHDLSRQAHWSPHQDRKSFCHFCWGILPTLCISADLPDRSTDFARSAKCTRSLISPSQACTNLSRRPRDKPQGNPTPSNPSSSKPLNAARPTTKTDPPAAPDCVESARLCTKCIRTRPYCVETGLGMLMYSSTLRFLAPFRLVWPSHEHISYRP